MENISRRDMLKGAAVAAASLGVAGMAQGVAFAAEDEAAGEAAVEAAAEEAPKGSVRVDGPGFNAGWGDTAVEDYGNQTFEEVVDGWFQYDWSYERDFEPAPAPGEKKNVCVVVSSAAIGGNGDTLADLVVDEIGEDANVEVLHLRDLDIAQLTTYGDILPVMQTSGQRDGEEVFIEALHKASVVIAIAPTYFNNIDSRIMLALTRTWGMCWKNPDYQYGPQKRTAVMLTCTGTKADWLKSEVRGIFTMADLSIISPEYRTEVFNNCGTPDAIANNDEYQEIARDLARWAIEDSEAAAE